MSSSQPSSWDGSDRHSGPHFVLNVFPGGKLILTTTDRIDTPMMNAISAMFRDWLNGEQSFPLVIGSCRVSITAVPAEEVQIQRPRPVNEFMVPGG